MIGKGVCPTCHGTGLEVQGNQIHCKVCGAQGDSKLMRWCLTVPMFEAVDPANSSFEGQLYQDAKGGYWQLSGVAQGCGREMTDVFCHACRNSLPHTVDYTVRKSRARPARA
jgi:hypothetical protein